jgi:hypothetical protein
MGRYEFYVRAAEWVESRMAGTSELGPPPTGFCLRFQRPRSACSDYAAYMSLCFNNPAMGAPSLAVVLVLLRN